MPVRIVKTELRCKFCKSEHRAELDALMEQASKREITREDVLARAAELGMVNPNLDNYTNHRKKHIAFVSADVAGQEEADLEEARRRVKANLDNLSAADVADQIIDFELRVFLEARHLAAERGDIEPATIDQVRALIGEKTKRKHNDAQDQLLTALGAGIGSVFEKALNPPAPVLVIEATTEATEEADVADD